MCGFRCSMTEVLREEKSIRPEGPVPDCGVMSSASKPVLKSPVPFPSNKAN